MDSSRLIRPNKPGHWPRLSGRGSVGGGWGEFHGRELADGRGPIPGVGPVTALGLLGFAAVFLGAAGCYGRRFFGRFPSRIPQTRRTSEDRDFCLRRTLYARVVPL